MAGWFTHVREIKVGVVGYGGAFNMGKQHLLEMRKAGMTPFAVCEVDAERLKIATEDFPEVETYASLDAMLKKSDVDLLVHITPHHLHYPLAKKCLQQGKHVVTEKPFVLNTKQADDLIRIADRNKLMVSTYHNRHWDGWILRAKQQIVDKNVIGEVFRAELHMGNYSMPKDWWRTSRSISGGVLYDWGVHLLEYALQAIDSNVTEVSGFAKNGYWESVAPKSFPWKGDANEDEATAIVRFRNGAMINLSISHLRSDPRSDHFVQFVGTKGSYSIGWSQWTTRIADRKHQLVEKTGKHPKGRGDLYYKNIAGYLTGKEELIITPEWARRPIHILDLAVQSAKQGRALKAKYG
jgi:predicted dehydrogenase